jgi:hypothetical protein
MVGSFVLVMNERHCQQWFARAGWAEQDQIIGPFDNREPPAHGNS